MKVLELNVKQMEERIQELKLKFGDSLYIPAHHYQKDEIVTFADDIGDSLQLAKLAAKNKKANYIVFCGVHFMAETADILTEPNQKVFLPNLNAGCSMADMANLEQAERSWNFLIKEFGESILPLTYVNSSASVKAFVGKNQGATVTSSNAKKILSWAFTQKERVLFLPDQHLGRNTAYSLGIALNEMAVWDPESEHLEYSGEKEKIKIILWKGHCSVHLNFSVVDVKKAHLDGRKIIVHPECDFDVVQLADYNGSTNKIITTIEESQAGSKWAVGTESNLVKRIIDNNPDKDIVSLNQKECYCETMNQIKLSDLLLSLENIVNNINYNQITVEKKIAQDAILALNRMLSI